MNPTLNIAVRAAREAGKIILQGFDRRDNLRVDMKSHNDFVSEIDLKAEQAIIKTLSRSFPDYGFIAEESGIQKAERQSPYQWIIDPLDGTTNFLHGNPQFAVSIALQKGETLEQAVIYDPLRDELYTASKGRGAFLNDRRIRVSNAQNLDGALLGTGFPFRDNSIVEVYIDNFRRLFTRTAGIRRAGSAALDLAYVAAGRLDGFWEFYLKPWDIAAGALLIQEAGGMVGEVRGGYDFLNSGHLVCGNPKIFKELGNLLRECLPADF